MSVMTRDDPQEVRHHAVRVAKWDLARGEDTALAANVGHRLLVDGDLGRGIEAALVGSAVEIGPGRGEQIMVGLADHAIVAQARHLDERGVHEDVAELRVLDEHRVRMLVDDLREERERGR